MAGTTWWIAKEYLKRLEINFEEHGKKTFSLFPTTRTKTEEIEVFPGKQWITLTTRLADLSSLQESNRLEFYERILKANAKLAEVNFGVDKRGYLIIRNVIPVTGISFDSFNSIYKAHLVGAEFFKEKLLPEIETQ
ncbi:MAG: hypothetical protein R6V83_08840 [Candidatus Thorarchaeota archaeon]